MPGNPCKTIIHTQGLPPLLLNIPIETFRPPTSLKIIFDSSITTKYACGVHSIRVGLSLTGDTYSVRTWTSCRFKAHAFERCQGTINGYAFSIRYQLNTFFRKMIGDEAELVVDKDPKSKKCQDLKPQQCGDLTTGHLVAEEAIVSTDKRDMRSRQRWGTGVLD